MSNPFFLIYSRAMKFTAKSPLAFARESGCNEEELSPIQPALSGCALKVPAQIIPAFGVWFYFPCGGRRRQLQQLPLFPVQQSHLHGTFRQSGFKGKLICPAFTESSRMPDPAGTGNHICPVGIFAWTEYEHNGGFRKSPFYYIPSRPAAQLRQMYLFRLGLSFLILFSFTPQGGSSALAADFSLRAQA